MINEVKVSIIIPVYNCELYISKCIESIIAQTLREIEIICIDDGSPDNSLEILKKYAQQDERIKIVSQNNQGVGAARNLGMKVATGEYVGFVDSDDWVDSNFYERLYNVAKKYNSDVSAADMYRHGKFLKTRKYKYFKEEFSDIPEQKMKLAGIPKYNYVWNKIYKREKIVECLFPEGVYYEDIGWSVKALYYLEGFVTVPNVFYHYIKHPNSIVTCKSAKHMADCEAMYNECINFFEKNNIKILIPFKLSHCKKYKLFNLTILKMEKYYPNIEVWKLFGITILKR